MPMTRSTRFEPASIPHPWRMAAVLVAALLLSVAQPLAGGLLEGQGVFDILVSLLIAAVLLLVFDERAHRRIAFSLAAAALSGVAVSHGLGGSSGRLFLIAAYVLAAGFFALVLYGMLRAILVRRVSGHAIFGAVCGYVLLGVIWNLLYCAAETACPGSFRMASAAGAEAGAGQLDGIDLSYFSFITLATVGYGDVTPTTPLARTLAWTEAITGQLYLAILVAGLVGFKVSQTTNKG